MMARARLRGYSVGATEPTGRSCCQCTLRCSRGSQGWKLNLVRQGPERWQWSGREPSRPKSLDIRRPIQGWQRPALTRGNRHIPLQDSHRARPVRPDTAGPEDRDQGRRLGAEPNDLARYAGVTAHRRKVTPSYGPTSTTRIAHQSLRTPYRVPR